MAPSISIREYIRWLPDEPSEPTSTLVLTSAENRFVDIRIKLPQANQTEAEKAGDKHILEFSRLDWAFAGTSSTEIITDPHGKQIVHSKWRHWVDSQSFDPEEEISDEGDMFPQKDGTTLESGSMVNPANGKMTEYEECWSDVEPTTTNEEGKKVCVVLKLHDDANKARGMVVRLGQLCQGFVRVGKKMALEKWAWEKEGGWRRQVRVGDIWLPCGVAIEDDKLKMDGEITFGEYMWAVIELNEF